MATIGVPPLMHPTNSKIDYTVLHGMKAAIEALSEPTELQSEKLKSDVLLKLMNRGRVICITSARDDESMKRLEEIFLNGLLQQNKNAAKSDRYIFHFINIR